MASKTKTPTRRVPKNTGLVRQLLSDAQSEYYELCVVKIATRRRGEYDTIGTIDRIDLKEKMIYINEAQAIEGVPFNRIVEYKWAVRRL